MERTESTVVQVAPSYENAKIREMEGFGWSLQGRQEIHEEGDALGEVIGTRYVVKTKVSHYVKLHFTRNQSLPNIGHLRQLETEYRGLPFPKVPTFTVPGCFSIFGVLGVLICLGMINQQGAPGVFGVVMYIVWTGLGVLWLKSRQQKRLTAQNACESSNRRMAQIQGEAEALL